MTKVKFTQILAKFLKEEFPLMTVSKCERVAKRTLGLFQEYKVIKQLEEDLSDTQLPEKP
jgi:sRNA-binding protein